MRRCSSAALGRRPLARDDFQPVFWGRLVEELIWRRWAGLGIRFLERRFVEIQLLVQRRTFVARLWIAVVVKLDADPEQAVGQEPVIALHVGRGFAVTEGGAEDAALAVLVDPRDDVVLFFDCTL